LLLAIKNCDEEKQIMQISYFSFLMRSFRGTLSGMITHPLPNISISNHNIKLNFNIKKILFIVELDFFYKNKIIYSFRI